MFHLIQQKYKDIYKMKQLKRVYSLSIFFFARQIIVVIFFFVYKKQIPRGTIKQKKNANEKQTKKKRIHKYTHTHTHILYIPAIFLRLLFNLLFNSITFLSKHNCVVYKIYLFIYYGLLPNSLF